MNRGCVRQVDIREIHCAQFDLLVAVDEAPEVLIALHSPAYLLPRPHFLPLALEFLFLIFSFR